MKPLALLLAALCTLLVGCGGGDSGEAPKESASKSSVQLDRTIELKDAKTTLHLTGARIVDSVGDARPTTGDAFVLLDLEVTPGPFHAGPEGGALGNDVHIRTNQGDAGNDPSAEEMLPNGLGKTELKSGRPAKVTMAFEVLRRTLDGSQVVVIGSETAVPLF